MKPKKYELEYGGQFLRKYFIRKYHKNIIEKWVKFFDGS